MTRWRCLFLPAAMALCLAADIATQTLPPAITVVADEWPPYNMEPGRVPEGYLIDVLRAVFEPLGIKVSYLVVPWERAVQESRKGIYTAIAGASKSDGEGFVFPEEELAVNRLTFFTSTASSWTFRDRSSVEATSLAVIDGYDYRAWLTEYVDRYRGDERRVQVMRGDHPLENNLRKVASGNVGAIVDSETAIRWTARGLGLEGKLRLAGQDSEPASIYVAFSPALKESPALARLLSEGIRELRRSGRLARILEVYGLRDWK